MSSKKKKYIPELRFPEFGKEGKWITKSIGSISKVSAGGTPTSTEPKYWGGDIPWMNSGELNLKRIYEVANSITELGLKESSTKKIPPLCVLIGLAGQGKTRGTAAINYIELCTNQSIAAIHPNKVMFNSEFLFYRIDFMYKTLRRLSTGQGGRGGLNLSIIKEIEIPFPSIREQQKIASCLSSLDELIAAHKDKLQALKDHKKGLLQNLFPQDGQKVPNYRFPEFVKDGEWVEITLDQVADYENGKAHEKEITKTGKYKVVNSKFISSDGETVKYTNFANLIAHVGDILMVLSDVPNGKAIAKCFYVDKDNTYTVNQRICKVTPTDIDNRFLFYTQNRNSYFLKFDDGVKQTNLRKDTVLSFPFLKPIEPKEQQKIASCLSALDDLITAQSEKIEQLQQHKKGLMQGLFPKLSELGYG